MRHYITILFLIFSTTSNAQTWDKENFVNQVYLKLVDTSYPYYLLSEQAYKLNRSDLIFKNNIPDSVKSEIEQNYLLDTTKYNWNYDKLSKAKKVNQDSIGIISGSTLRIFSLNSWSKRKRKKEEAKQLEFRSKQREKMKPYDKRVYFFSNPVFDKNKRFAIIKMSYGCGFTCGYGCTYLFELIDNKWTLILTGTCIAA